MKVLAVSALTIILSRLHIALAFAVINKGAGSSIFSPTSRRMASRAGETIDFFEPIKSFITSLSAPTRANPGAEFDEPINMALSILYEAAEKKKENTDAVYNALVELERLQRSKRKAEVEVNDDYSTAERMLQNLDGEWRLIFTTGTKETQNKLGGNRINYFPIKV
jgi:hypothetical protein